MREEGGEGEGGLRDGEFFTRAPPRGTRETYTISLSSFSNFPVKPDTASIPNDTGDRGGIRNSPRTPGQ